jgi:glutathione synthase
MHILFIMDPAEAMLPDKDTTFAFIRAAQKRGHCCLHAAPEGLSVRGRRVFVRARPLSVNAVAPFVVLGEAETFDVHELGAVMIRKDPPFDTAYLHLTQELDLVKADTLVVNEPVGLREANEKLFALQFEEWMPRTLVTCDREELLQFTRDVGGRAVLKPLDGAGGSGVVALRTDDKNARALTDILTHEGKVQAMVQEYQEEVVTGDKRVLLLDGKLLGAILRVPRADDIRANIHVGGRVEPTELTRREQALVDAVGPRLSQAGLYFVGLDLIGEKLIEVNVTSPTGIQELGRFNKSEPEAEVIAWLEKRVGVPS